MPVLPPPETGFDLHVPVLVIGAGACGLVAALSVREAGGDCLVVEADAVPSGSTALSAGLIPAAGTRFQREAGIEDDATLFAGDIQRKAKGENPQHLVDLLADDGRPTVEWLADRFGLPFSSSPISTTPAIRAAGCTACRRARSRTGRPSARGLRGEGVDIVCNRRATTLFAEAGRIAGVEVIGPRRAGAYRLRRAGPGLQRLWRQPRDGGAHIMPEITGAVWFGHDGNRGDALDWGEALGAESLHLGAYQGHGNVAHPEGILITWAVITEGGIQVNTDGDRFWDESQGYSEAARAVLAQPGGIAWTIFDTRIAGIARQFQDFKDAEAMGAIRVAEDIPALARMTGLPDYALADSLAARPADGPDAFGRSFSGPPLSPPYCAVKVTGALFHTQGGLNITDEARVTRPDGTSFENLFAAGGAAVGVSGKGDSGYLSGNGLLSAIVLGHIAGTRAARDTIKGD
jgi:fumarate reductase flavoprotein subunit